MERKVHSNLLCVYSTVYTKSHPQVCVCQVLCYFTSLTFVSVAFVCKMTWVFAFLYVCEHVDSDQRKVLGKFAVHGVD